MNQVIRSHDHEEDDRLQCANCGDWRHGNELVDAPINPGALVCEGCRDDLLSTCSACGEIRNLVAYAQPHEGYCSGCTDALNAEQFDREPKSGKCPGCGRPCRECWILPCLELEVALHSGAPAVNAWLEQAGAPFRVEPKQ